MAFQSTGDDAKDLAMLRAAKNIDDGPVSMKRGGKVIYILLVSGQGAIIEKGEKEDHFLRMSKGMCVYIPRNTSHVFLATTDCESVSFLTKPWNDCENPIIHENLGHGKGDFGDPDSAHHEEQHLEAFSEDK